MGLLLNKQQTQDLHNYKVAVRDLGLTFKGLGNMIGADFAPFATKAIRAVIALLQSLAPVIRVIALAAIVYINDTIDEIVSLVAAIQTVPVVITQLQNVLQVGATSLVKFGASPA